jgi:hypothetical protein
MNFVKKDLKLVQVRPYTKKKEDGTERLFHFIKLADKQTYESQEFMLDAELTKPETLELGNDYDATLMVDGRFSSVRLDPVVRK